MTGLPPAACTPQCPVEYVEWVQAAMSTAIEFANQHLGKAAV